MRYFLRSMFLTVVFASAAVSAIAAAAPIDKAAVNALCAAADHAIVSNDIDALSKLIAANAKIINTNVVDGERQTVELSKAEYLDALVEQRDAITDYRYDRQTLSIEIVEKGRKAIGRDRTVESMSMDGTRLRAITISTFIVELVKGVPVITSIVGESTVSELEGVYEI